MKKIVAYKISLFFLVVSFLFGYVLSVQAQTPPFSCPAGSTYTGQNTPDTNCPLCRHNTTNEVFSVAQCSSSGDFCTTNADCASLPQQCPAGENFVSWLCSTTDGSPGHCVQSCSGSPIIPTPTRAAGGGGGGYRTDSNEVRTGVGDGGSSNPGSRPDAPDCPGGDCRQAVLEKFGVTVSTSLPEVYGQYVWDKLWDVSNTNFDELVRGTRVELASGGSHRSGNTIYLRSSYTPPFFDIIFVHEMGHVINDLEDPVSRRTEHNGVFDRNGGVTGYGDSACLYGSGAGYDARIEENYADMLAYYLNPGVVDQTTGVCDWGIVPYGDGRSSEYFNLAQKILGVY